MLMWSAIPSVGKKVVERRFLSVPSLSVSVLVSVPVSVCRLVSVFPLLRYVR